MDQIKDLISDGNLEEVFAPLLPLFPQAFRYLSPELRDEIWPIVQEYITKYDIQTSGTTGEEQIRSILHTDPVQLASEIDREPFKTLIRTILSARTRDDQTIKISNILFEHFDTPEKLAKAPENDVKEIIRPIGFYNSKTRYIMETSKMLLEEFDGKVPSTFKELVKLPGVGSKVANCVLVYAFGIPAIPVDTHVHRIANRWGLVNTTNPEKTNQRLEEILPKEWWLVINDLLIRFGKEICKPINPSCDDCPLNHICPKIMKKKKASKKKRARKTKKKK